MYMYVCVRGGGRWSEFYFDGCIVPYRLSLQGWQLILEKRLSRCVGTYEM